MKRKFICFIMLIVSLVAVRFLTVEQVSGEENGESLESIFTEFYNEGVYAKDTVIYIDNAKVESEIAQYFHARKPSYQRTTYYSGDKLWFSYGSGYGTSEDGHLTQFKMVDGVVTNESVNKSLPGMENYYCTLNDFVLGEHQSAHTNNVKVNLSEGWTNENGVYTSSAQGVLEGFRLFVAPTWLGKTAETANYIDFTKATVEKAGQALIMKLWVSSTEIEGKLVNNTEVNGEHAVFAKAVIVKDTASYSVINGGFENGTLEGWTKSGQIGAVSSESNYWTWEDGGYSFNKDGEYLFSSYADDNEGSTGWLSSSNFVVGGTGWITFKIGAAKNRDLMNVQVVDANTGDILKTFGNTAWVENIEGVKTGCSLFAYKANISDLLGKEVYIRVVDYAVRDYGCLFFDSLNTYYTTTPSDEFIYAEDLGIRGNVHQLFNGDFERGNADGWSVVNDIGSVSDFDSYWGNVFNKDGRFLFSAYEPDRERFCGSLISSKFVVGGNGWITFKLGGGPDSSLVNLQIVDANTHETLKTFGNQNWTDADGRGCQLNAYRANISDLIGREVYIKVVDNAWTFYGLFFLDSVNTYYLEEPNGDAFATATNLNITTNAFEVFNGGFESGNKNGWSVEGQMGAVTDNNNYWGGSFGKGGNFLFSSYADDNEGARGYVSSNSFVVGGSGWITYRIGAFGHGNDGGAFYEGMYVLVIDANNGNVLRKVYSSAWHPDNKCDLINYKLDLTEFQGRTVYLRFVDDQSSFYGCMFIDDVVTYNPEVPGDHFHIAQ